MRRIRLARVLMKVSDLLPKKYPLRAKGDLEKQPFFVFGSGRNGSTLLNRLLNQHSQLFLPSEQYFLGHSIIKYKLYNFLVWRDLVKIISGELAPAAQSHTWNYDGGNVLQPLFEMKNRGLDQIMDIIFRGYAQYLGQDCQMWGDTTPPNIHYFKEVYSLFPNGKYLFLIRDGRDVVASHKKGGKEFLGEMAGIDQSSKLWNESVDAYFWLKKKTDVLLIRYEDLVADPQSILTQVCTHLGLEYEVQMLNEAMEIPDLDMFKEPIHQNLSKPIFRDSIGSFSSILTKDELEQCDLLISKNLKRMQYR